MNKILVFAGTTEGYEITEFLESHGIFVYMCVATDYGSVRLKESSYLRISHERMDAPKMADLMRQESFLRVIDATHPYAVEVTDNIQKACEMTGTACTRVLRASGEIDENEDTVMVDSVEDAVAYLASTRGNILLTIGSKQLSAFTSLPDYKERVYARVLSLPGVVAQCAELGFQGAHLICMQGPFLKELNTAMLKQYDCRYLVTKEAGDNGGFQEKCEAAADAHAKLVVIGRPRREEGISLGQCIRQLCKELQIQAHPQVTLVGIGMGSPRTQTVEAREALAQADCIIGGRRLVDAVARKGQEVCCAYDPDRIKAYIDSHPEYRRVAVALSGDVGFYSGARKLLGVLGEETGVICGISSVAYFMAKIHLSWDDAAIVSAHGKNCNLIHYIKANRKTFAILGSGDGVANLAAKLVLYGMTEVTVYVGEDLSYPGEKITQAPPAELTQYEASSLSVVCVVNPDARPTPAHLGDEDFIRGKTPMTKAEVRTLSVEKLALPPDAVCYDVGAGTGSVSIEMAVRAGLGRVYAIEKNAAAVELIRENQKKHAVDNLTIIEGMAPEALQGLEAPTHAFIGGSSGNLYEIAALLLDKNPEVRLVINCITLETVSESLSVLARLPFAEEEIIQITVAKSREVGNYHMMTGENPIYIISARGVRT